MYLLQMSISTEKNNIISEKNLHMVCLLKHLSVSSTGKYERLPKYE